MLIDCIFRVVGAVGHHASDSDRGFNLTIGSPGMIVGLLTFHAPAITALALLSIPLAAWAMMIGATEIALAIKMRREIKGEWFLILMGLVSIIFSRIFSRNPLAGGGGAFRDDRLVRSDKWVFWRLFFGFRLRSLAAQPTQGSTADVSSPANLSG